MPQGPASGGAVEWTARRLVEQHAEPADPARATGRCAQCPPDGGPDACELLAWARVTLAVAAVPSEPKN